MKPRITVAAAVSPDGTVLELVSHGPEYVITFDGIPLMSTRMHHSEEELARLGCAGIREGDAVLVGGLGVGYTLRAALDLLPAGARVVQAELVPEVLAWNRGCLGPFAGRPLDDPRVEVVLGDVAAVLRGRRSAFAALLLDVDNGPCGEARGRNAWLYSAAGLAAIRRALVPGGRVAVWAAVDHDEGFPERLRAAGFQASKHRVAPHPGRGGTPHVIHVGRSDPGPGSMEAGPRPVSG